MVSLLQIYPIKMAEALGRMDKVKTITALLEDVKVQSKAVYGGP